MATKVSPHLWDDLLTVVSSLTRWKEVITEWQVRAKSSVMLLTNNHIASTVYLYMSMYIHVYLDTHP